MPSEANPSPTTCRGPEYVRNSLLFPFIMLSMLIYLFNRVTLYPQEGYKGPITGIQIFYPQLSNARECLVLRGSLQNKVMSARFGNNLNCFGYQTKDCSEGPLNGLGTPLYPGFLLRLDYPNTKEGRGGEDLEKLQSFECNR